MKNPIDGKLEFLRDMARRLLSLSDTYERQVTEGRPAIGETLGLLGSLERVTRQSFETAQAASGEPCAPVKAASSESGTPLSPHSARSSTSSTPGAARTPAAWVDQELDPAPRLRFGTARAEYRPALEQPSLVDALLRLQDRARHPSRRSALIKASPPAEPQPPRDPKLR